MWGIEFWEFLSYLVTVIGLPLAIFTYWKEQRKERENARPREGVAMTSCFPGVPPRRPSFAQCGPVDWAR